MPLASRPISASTARRLRCAGPEPAGAMKREGRGCRGRRSPDPTGALLREHDARHPVRPVQQHVDQDERVAGAGVPAGDDERDAGGEEPLARSGSRPHRLRGRDRQAQRRSRRPEQHRSATPRRDSARAGTPGRAASTRTPRRSTGRRARRGAIGVPDEVDEREPEHPQRADVPGYVAKMSAEEDSRASGVSDERRRAEDDDDRRDRRAASPTWRWAHRARLASVRRRRRRRPSRQASRSRRNALLAS